MTCIAAIHSLVDRDVVATIPLQLTHTLTPVGESLGAAIAHNRTWAYGYIAAVELARTAFDRDAHSDVARVNNVLTRNI